MHFANKGHFSLSHRNLSISVSYMDYVHKLCNMEKVIKNGEKCLYFICYCLRCNKKVFHIINRYHYHIWNIYQHRNEYIINQFFLYQTAVCVLPIFFYMKITIEYHDFYMCLHMFMIIIFTTNIHISMIYNIK